MPVKKIEKLSTEEKERRRKENKIEKENLKRELDDIDTKILQMKKLILREYRITESDSNSDSDSDSDASSN